MRRAVIVGLGAAVVLALGVTLAATPAAAQLCHDHGLAPAAPVPPPRREPRAKTSSTTRTTTPAAAPTFLVTTGVSVEGAQVVGGSYAGVSPHLAVRWRRLAAEVTVPVYRLALGDTRTGLGDVVVATSGHLRRLGPVDLTAVLSASLPTGDQHHGFGMGHVMAMPGLAVATGQRARLAASLTLGAALTGTGHEHMVNVVAPMNRTELAGAVSASFPVTPALAPEVSAAMSEPLGDGVRRAAAGVGATAWFGPWQLRAAAQLGLAGDPYNTRLVVEGRVRLP